MRFSIVSLALMLTAAAQSDQDEAGAARCGTDFTNSTIPIPEDRFPTQEVQRRARQPISIDLYMHFVGKDNTTPEKMLRKRARRQVDALNDAFDPSDISFNTKGVLFHVDPKYAVMKTGSDLVGMIRKYRRGDTKTLNLFIPSVQGGELGIGACVSFDDIFTRRTIDASADGCSISPNGLAASSSALYSEGKTAVHEAGHWLGLLHTFEGGCNGAGDHISDTPAQAYMTMTCDETQDTCPSQPGLDPIHNYMGYAPDSCMTEFTPHQALVMHHSWNHFRK